MRYLYILRYLCGLFWLTNLASHVAAQANSSAGPPRAALTLGSAPPNEVTVTTETTGVVLHVGRLSVQVPISNPSDLQAETVHLKGGANVGVLRLTAAGQSAAVLVVKRPGGALEALWTGRLQLSGDPGERRADALEVADRDGDGEADVVVGSYDEQVRVCGEDRTLLAPRAVDPKTLTLRSVLLNRATQRPISAQLVASATAAASPNPPLLHALRAVGASSASPDPGQSVAAITDGDLNTSWVEGRGLGGRFEFATLRWNASNRPITALAVVAAPPSPPTANANLARIRVLSLLGPRGEHFTATLSEDPRPGQRYWITPPQPLDWSCLTVSIDDVFATQLGPQTHALLTEVEAYTELDKAGGFSQLIAELSVPGTRGDDATELLQHANGDVVAGLIEAWPQLPQLGKRRALRLLFGRPASADPRTSAILRNALRDSDADISTQALRIAGERVPFGAALLEELAHSATRQGDSAALVIAHAGAQNSLELLLGILLEQGGSERANLREALAVAYQTRGATAAEVVKPWLEAGPNGKPVAARAALALALSRATEARADAQALVRSAAADAREFPEQWRLVQAAMPLPSEATVDAWLDGLAKQSDAWMLRVAAVDALQQRGSTLAAGAAQRALQDDYPRVRAVGVRALAPDPKLFTQVAKIAQEDKWFLVRQAALEKLPDTPDARGLFVEALKDKTAIVRTSAVQALLRVNASAAWAQVKPLLDNAEEYPEVIAAAVAFARGLCIEAAVPSLQAVVTRGMQPEAWTADQDLAFSALEALSGFGGQAATWARDHAVGPQVPKEVQSAAAAAAKQPGTCRIRTTL